MRDSAGRFIKGSSPANKLPDITLACIGCGGEFLKDKKNPATRHCSHACWAKTARGVPKSEATKRKMSENNARYWLGKHQSPQQIEATRIRLAKWQSGPNHWNWKGGITPVLKSLRFTAEYKAWRKAVYERDGYTCQDCGQSGGKLNADHIVPFAKIVREKNWDLLRDIANGRTLCEPCHKLTPTYGVKAGAF